VRVEKGGGSTSPSKVYAKRGRTADFLLGEGSVEADPRLRRLDWSCSGRLEDDPGHPEALSGLRVGAASPTRSSTVRPSKPARSGPRKPLYLTILLPTRGRSAPRDDRDRLPIARTAPIQSPKFGIRLTDPSPSKKSAILPSSRKLARTSTAPSFLHSHNRPLYHYRNPRFSPFGSVHAIHFVTGRLRRHYPQMGEEKD